MKLLKSNIALACIFIAGGAFADSGKPLNAFYMGALFGQSSIDTGIDNVVGATLEEEDRAYSFFIGSEVAENVSVEAFYSNFGEASLLGQNDDAYRLAGEVTVFNSDSTIKVAGKSMGIAAKLGFDITDKFRGFVKGGWHFWGADLNMVDATGTVSETDGGNDLVLGLGIEYDFNKDFAFIVGYDRYKLDGDNIDIDVDFLHAGIKVRF